MNETLYTQLNKDWKSTCKIVLGEELGELKEFEPWLKEFFPNTQKRKSHLSGEDVTLVMDDYCKGANFVSMKEIKEKSVEPLSINEVKDIDSIIKAIGDKWEYTGNRSLGNSAFVESSDLITDSQYIGDCVNLTRMSHCYSSFHALDAKYCFGSGLQSHCEFLIKHIRGSNCNRCFQTLQIQDCSDLYESSHCYGCHDLLFSSNQLNKKYLIGNLQLSKEQYQPIKKKLLAEMADELKKNKKFPSLLELIPNEDLSEDIKISFNSKESEENMDPIEKAFKSTFKILFKKEASSLSDYEDWLSKRIVPLDEFKSPFGSTVYVPKNHPTFSLFSLYPKKRLVTYNEGIELGKMHILENEVSNLDKLKEWISKTNCIPTQFFAGENRNMIKSTVFISSYNIYNAFTSVRSENSGVTSWPIDSKYSFGCHWVADTQYSIKCYNSFGLTRCFEVDTSTRCTDTLFSHNSEALTDCMFCFNVKGKRYAIGNTPLTPDKYKSIKSMVLEQISSDLLRKKSFDLDIFDIGCQN